MVKHWKTIALILVCAVLVFWAGCNWREKCPEVSNSAAVDSLIGYGRYWQGQAAALKAERDTMAAERHRFEAAIESTPELNKKLGHAIRSGGLRVALDTLGSSPDR